MAKAKTVSGTAKETAARRTKKASTPKVAAVKRPAPRRVAKKSPPRASSEPKPRILAHDVTAEPESMSEAQSQVVASKFASAETARARPPVRPTLPSSYGESHLLLLVRDPQTLFAAWDIAPSTIEGLKARLGRRGFAVSSLTLRLTLAGGGTSVIHVGNKVRSRYLKIDGGPSFIAEIGFTIPAGRFELVARSAPCFVPMGPLATQAFGESGRRAVAGYREARALVRRGGARPHPGARARPQAGASKDASASASAGGVLAPRTLGGASDLYRR